MKTYIVTLAALFIMIAGCGEKDQHKRPSTPTSGELIIGIDESLMPFIEAEIAMFSSYYPDARITPLYLPEKQVVEKLLTNELQTGIICRDLYIEESDFIKNKFSHQAATFKLADDGIAAVVNNANPINTISYDDIKRILSGKTADWGQIDRSLKDKSPITVIITGSSSIDRFLSSSEGEPSPVSTYALDTTDEVIDYVKKNASAIGILGGSWFYQKGNRYPDVKVLALSRDSQINENRRQDLSREVYAVTHEPFTGLGNGFIAFMASQRGQLIISKAGMTPFKPIEREIKLLDSFEN